MMLGGKFGDRVVCDRATLPKGSKLNLCVAVWAPFARCVLTREGAAL